MFIRVGGVPCVGKTTIINRIVEASEKLGAPVVKVKGGDYLLDILGVSSYDELREIPESVRLTARPEMYRKMYTEDREDPVTIRLRDAHYSLWQKDCGFVYFPAQEEDRNQLLSMVCISAPSEVVLSRRLCDRREDRSYEVEIISQEINTELETARAQSMKLGHELVLIDNIGDISSSCRKLVEATMSQFPFKQELEGELLNGDCSRERKR